MKTTLSVLLSLLFLLNLQTAFATHIVGGEITYRCLGNDNYEISLTVYRDCFNGQPAFDDPAIVGVYKSGTDSLFLKLNIAYNDFSNDTIPIVLNNPCLVVPPDICVHKATYKRIISLPFRPEGYTIVYQRCCRNRLIRNIPDPLNSGISFITEITGIAMQACNNSASFNSWPPVAICVHEPIDFDHSASDPDGDSLSYRLCTPLNGPDSLNSVPNPPSGPPYNELVWLDPPYNLSNLMGGDPLTIDPATGFMTGIPNTIGNYVIGVCVDEFRNDSLISITRRDFQYNVADCGSPTAAFASPDIICDTLDVHFTNLSQYALYFRWYFDWPDNLNQTSVAYSPNHSYPDTGMYTVALIAEPNTMCSDTFLFQIELKETDGSLIVTADPSDIQQGGNSQLEASFPGADIYRWVQDPDLSEINIANPIATPTQTSTYTVTAFLPNGCQKTGEVEVRVVPPPCDQPYVFFPTGFSPNGDGQNDELKLESNIASEVYWVIYNRWGEKLFEANSLEDSWDGTYKGQDQPAETYGYFLHVKCEDGNETSKKGNVTLLR
ncbi:MAG: gliding motility-associated C-terminal domain-containing protein [Saprospiraceae bacterium]|nr:gliding motility-associated C-terminal domain-containing protein [Saprospiraceae bacterium]MCB9342145.1 gliding motility-associated C-terminal domain-containing protein [Lewinellaceae bacterium]